MVEHVKELVSSANKNKLHSFELAAIIHARLAWIHPFEDGNGRTARAVMNYLLMKKGFPIFFIPYGKRDCIDLNKLCSAHQECWKVRPGVSLYCLARMD